MYQGGVATIKSIQKRPAQVHSDDFVSCVQIVLVNGRSLNLASTLKSRRVTSSCQRRSDICQVNGPSCGQDGTGLDHWSNATCVCQEGLEAPNCFAALEPLSFTEGSALHSSNNNGPQKWKRETSGRRLVGHHLIHRRDIGIESVSLHNSVSVRFRTVAKQGV